jgi:hypothetical protein
MASCDFLRAELVVTSKDDGSHAPDTTEADQRCPRPRCGASLVDLIK